MTQAHWTFHSRVATTANHERGAVARL
jgi:hypothetical protein